MEQREFGRTGHASTVIIFGAFAVGRLTQPEADETMQLLLNHEVNHIDVAPSYYSAEERIGPWLEKFRDRFFVGCKTMEREREAASQEMHESRKRLRIDAFDLYQLHAVTTMEELEQCLAPGGALEAVQEARDQDLTRFIGITSHGLAAPSVLMAALERFPFDSVLFPVNFKLWANKPYRTNAEALLKIAAERDVGVMAIKAVAKGLWGDREPQYNTWYEPFDDAQMIDRAVRFTLSQPVTGAVSAGDARLLPAIVEAAEQFEPMTPEEQDDLMAEAVDYELIFG